tara:strand:+ start:645 stop:1034 length:390 start_codon:yes stop_codon:yes gene_type:complete
MQKLTEKQIIFCEEYIKDFNGTRSAKAAGYSEDSARTIACDMLTKQYIKDNLNLLTKERNERLRVDTDAIVKELARIGLAKESSDIAGGFDIDVKDKIKALELLARHVGLFNNDESEKNIINVTVGGKG